MLISGDPSIFFSLFGVGSQWQQDKQVSRHPSFQRHFQTPSRGTRGILRLHRLYNPSSAWIFPATSSQLGVPGRPPKGGALEVSWSDTQTTSADSFQDEGAVPSGCLKSSWHLPWGWAKTPSRESSFLPLVSAISFFWTFSRVHDHKWGLSRPVNQICLLARLHFNHNGPSQCPLHQTAL